MFCSPPKSPREEKIANYEFIHLKIQEIDKRKKKIGKDIEIIISLLPLSFILSDTQILSMTLKHRHSTKAKNS